MGMLSYKQYKLLHENLDSVIGISAPSNVGLRSEAPQLMGMKRMGADPGMGDPMGMGMGMGGPMSALKKKPAIGGDMDDPDAEEDMDGLGADAEGDLDDAEGDMDDAEGDLDDAEGDMDDAEGDLDDAEGELDDEEGDLDDAEGDEDEEEEEGDEEGLGSDMGGDMMGGGMGGPMGAGSPPPGMGGPMAGPDMGMGLGGPPMKGKKPKMMPSYMRKEAADPQDAKMKGQNRKNGANIQNDCGPGPASKKTTTVREAGDPQDAKMKGQNRKNGANDQNDCGPGPASKKTTTVREGKCCDKCGHMMSKKCNKMTKEQREFNDSLKRQSGALKFKQDEYGYWVAVQEDVLIQQPQQVQNDEPQPGEVGFAPQAKIGILGSNFSEWASRHKK